MSDNNEVIDSMDNESKEESCDNEVVDSVNNESSSEISKTDEKDENDDITSEPVKKTTKKEEVVRLTIRMPIKTNKLIEKIAEYLHREGMIKKPSKNEAMIYSIYNLGKEIILNQKNKDNEENN